MKLLEKVKNQKSERRRIHKFSQEELIETAIAWGKDEITYAQISRAFGYNGKAAASVYIRLAIGLRDAVRFGRLKEKV